MFGVILEVAEDRVVIQNTKGEVLSQVLGEHVVFEDTENRILGEISAIDSRTITCMLIGEFVNGEYQSGLDHRISNNCLIISVNKLNNRLKSFPKVDGIWGLSFFQTFPVVFQGLNHMRMRYHYSFPEGYR